MPGRGKEGCTWSFLDQLAGIHDTDAMRHARHHAQIMRDQQHAHVAFSLQILQQIENLRLDRDIERGGRLISDQQGRVAGQGHGNHHPLFHTTGKLEGIFVEPAIGIGNANGRQQLAGTNTNNIGSEIATTRQHFANLATDRHDRVEAGRRLLKDHGHATAPNPAHVHFRQAQQFAAIESNIAAQYPPGGRQQAHQGQRSCGFPAA